MFQIRKRLTKDNVLELVSESAIFKHYIPEFQDCYTMFSSVLREDRSPSCSIIASGDRLVYKDLGTQERLDCFGLVMRLYDVSFMTALAIIDRDFNLGLDAQVPKGIPERPALFRQYATTNEHRERAVIQIKIRNWLSKIDTPYWGKYGIPVSTLTKFNVFPLQCFWLNGQLWDVYSPRNRIYCYWFGNGMFKVLRPDRSSSDKWRNNASNSCVQGWEYYKDLTGEIMIVTKSLKDVMVFHELGIPSVAPQSEGVLLSCDVVDSLQRRFSKVYIMYDNDPTGRQRSLNMCQEYPALVPIFVPDSLHEKDISDVVKSYGMQRAKDLMVQLVENLT